MEGDGAEFHPPFELGPEADYDEIIPAWEEQLRALGSIPVSTPSANLDTDDLAVQIAWSAQAAVESIVPALVEHARAITGLDAVCLAGGVALNCSTNGLLADPVYVPPVSADAGGALGAAWAVAPPPAPLDPLSPYLGPDVQSADLDSGGLDGRRARARRGRRAPPATVRSAPSPGVAPRSARGRSATGR